MNFIFWQNMISIHQSSLLLELAKRHTVTLVVPQTFEDIRKNSGWDIPQLVGVKLMVSPTPEQINAILADTSRAHHIFSGINAYPMVHLAFRKAIFHGIRPLLYMEPFNTLGIKGKLRSLKYRLLALRYRHHIGGILATGAMGVTAYTKVGFFHQSICEWGYFTTANYMSKHTFDAPSHVLPICLYVGELSERKNVMILPEVLKDVPCEHCYIVGKGDLEHHLQTAMKDMPTISFMGAMPNEQVREFMRRCDILLLPSLFDGWGAVVNEALQNGMRVLCSDACGAAVLLDEQTRGGCFEAGNITAMRDALKYWLAKGALSIKERTDIAEWATRNISGVAAAQYFEQICRYLSGKSESKPLPPWKTNRQIP